MIKSPVLLSAVFATCVAVPVFAEDAPSDEVALVKEMFARIQPLSIEGNVEYCGEIGFDADGVLKISEPAKGQEASCLPPVDQSIVVVTASYHTHGGYSTDYFNEVPSVTDIEADEEEGIDGYVATPGGRLWYVDTTDMEVSQLCGLGCLFSDPDFIKGSDGIIEQSYVYDDLVTVFEEDHSH